MSYLSHITRGCLVAWLPAAVVLAQTGNVGIGTTTPNAAAALDITSTSKGLLIPRLDSTARVAIGSPPAGLLVYQTAPRAGFYYYTGSAWVFVPDKARAGDNLGSHTATQNINLAGRLLVGGTATSPGTTGLGVTAAGNVGIGTTTPTALLDVVGSTRLRGLTTSGVVTNAADGTLGTATAASLDATTASNGLTKTSTDLALGGTLTRATTIAQGSNNFSLTGGNVGIGTSSPTARLTVAQTLRVDNSNTTPGQIGQNISTAATSGVNGQTFTLPVGATIRQIDVFVNSGTGNLYIYKGSPVSGAALLSQSITYTAGYGTTTVVLATPIVITAPGIYSFCMSGADYVAGTSTDTYSGGNAYYNTYSTNGDLKFAVRYDIPNDATLYVATSGNVGIGTSSPTAQLHVAGSARIESLTTAGVVTTDASGNLSSSTSGSNFILNQTSQQATSNFNISGDGVIGGTATAASVHVSDATAINGQGAYLQWNRSGSEGETWLINQLGQGGSNAGIRFGGISSSATSVTEWARFNNSGQLGIGASPITTLDVRTTDNSAAITVGNTGNTAGALYLGNPNHGLKRNYNAGNDVGLYTTSANLYLSAAGTSTSQFALLNSGYVGIGTGSPTQKLDVDGGILARSNGLIGTQGAHLQWNRSGSEGETWLLNQKGGGTANAGIRFGSSDAVSTGSNSITEWARFTDNGNLGLGTITPSYKLDVNGQIRANNVSVTSDQRLKQHIRPLTGALVSVLALRGVRYTWNALGVQRGGQAGAEQIGLLAQEVEKTYPELVATDAQGYKSVNYAQLAPVLIEALKEQQAQVEELQQQAAAATQRAARAEASLTSFEQRLRALEGTGTQASK